MMLPIGIVGFGARATLADELQSMEGVEVRAICDPSEAARHRARSHFPDALITGDLREFLDAGVAAALVLSPDDTHASITKACLEAGLAVFCEKPIAITIEDADDMLEVARRTGARLYIGHNMRHMPLITMMRDIIRSGRIGKVTSVWTRHFVGNGGDWYFKDWHAERSRVTSLLLQKGAHDIDVIHWLAGGYTRRVSAMGALTAYDHLGERGTPDGELMYEWIDDGNWPARNQTGINPKVDVEDLSVVTMQLDNGVIATYQQCHYTPDTWRSYTVIGTEGRIENFCDADGEKIHVLTDRHVYPQPDEVIAVPIAEGTHSGADPRLLAEFLRFVAEGGSTATSPVAARQAAAVGVLAAQSMRTDQGALTVPALPEETIEYFDLGQPGSRSAALSAAS